MEQPDEVHLSRKDGEALIERLHRDALTALDRHVLEQVLRWYFWLLFALQEARFSLKRLRAMVFGDRAKKRPQQPSSGGVAASGSRAGGPGATLAEAPASQADYASPPPSSGERRPGHGRQGAQAYSGAEHVVCRHETLAVGERCPVCGRGRLYRVEPGVEMRLDGHALLSAVRYVLEKFRCSACGQVFTAATPPEAGADKYSARARAVLVLGRYYLGVPLYRLEGYQAMVGGPVSDATQWDQIERVADCAYPVFEQLKALAAQGEVIPQDDTHVRILSLIAENRRTQTEETSGARTGMYTTALVAQQGTQTICLYFAGRAHAGENLEALLAHREADRGRPLVMSDALASNAADEDALIRCHCLAHGRRKFSELEDVFPAECAIVIEALRQVVDHEEAARVPHMSAEGRLRYHQQYSGPIMDHLKHWLAQQFEEHRVEPNSRLGKNTAERALKLAIRQRKNSLFYATDYSASIASLLTSLIATGLHAGGNALEYLVALQEHRPAVFRDPAAWLPWNYHTNLAPP
jgi:hypothetical protein